ncbi:MAG: glycosyltransferase [Bacteroidales bacterium]|nr:glycosyltransferase [Bacteroidales bacterium]
MRKILIAIHYMEIGGAEMSLLGLLESLDFSEVQVDLFVYNHKGDLMRHIPPQVNVLPEIPEYKQIERPVKDVLKDGFFRIALARLKGKRQFASYLRRTHPKDGTAIYSFISRNLVPILPDICPQKEYDMAISYLMPHDYVLRKVKAKEKVAWIHTDYSQVDVDAVLELPVWSGYDKIASISADVTRSFIEVFPSLAEKIIEKPNVVPVHYVKSCSALMAPLEVEKEMPRAPGRINLLSVGRFCYAKNYENVPDICHRLRLLGLDVYWYLIGFGETDSLVRKSISEAGMGDYVRILGKKENPYPYMEACDYYVQPSRYEGSPMTVLEAKALGKRVIVSAFPTAGSIGDVEIVPVDNEGCAAGIAAVIKRNISSYE